MLELFAQVSYVHLTHTVACGVASGRGLGEEAMTDGAAAVAAGTEKCRDCLFLLRKMKGIKHMLIKLICCQDDKFVTCNTNHFSGETEKYVK